MRISVVVVATALTLCLSGARAEAAAVANTTEAEANAPAAGAENATVTEDVAQPKEGESEASAVAEEDDFTITDDEPEEQCDKEEDFAEVPGASEAVNVNSTSTAAETESQGNSTSATGESGNPDEKKDEKQSAEEKDLAEPFQAGPLIDLLGPSLLSLELIDANTAMFKEHLTTDALRGKTVIGLYFSADWCGPCRKFTPELVNFYKKMNARKGRENQFEIVWVSRCRDNNAYQQYFTQMGWLALPPEIAMGPRGQELSNKYKVKGIPSLVLLDDLGQVITTDARNRIPNDRAGIGFPWRSPLATLYMNVVPKTIRHMIKSNVETATTKLTAQVKNLIPFPKKAVQQAQ